MTNPSAAELEAVLRQVADVRDATPPLRRFSASDVSASVDRLRTELGFSLEAAGRRLRPVHIFDVLRVREATLTRFYAWVLDPRGGHGLGPDALRLLLLRLRQAHVGTPLDTIVGAMSDYPLLGAAQVLPEQPLPGGQIDLLIKVGDYRLYLEVKLWAHGHGNQLAVYEREVQEHAGRAGLAVLAPAGHPAFVSEGFDGRPALAHSAILDPVEKWARRLDQNHSGTNTLREFTQALLAALQG